MQTSQRFVIEELKAELRHYRAVHERLLRAGGGTSAEATGAQQIAHLEDQILSYRSKAQSEQELIRQTQKELEQAKQQLDQHRNKQRQPGLAGQHEHCYNVPAAAGSATSHKSAGLLKERLLHQKEKLDEAVSKNKVLRSQIEEFSTRGNSAKRLHAKLQRQLTEAVADAERLKEHIEAVLHVQQLAASLAEQLRLQDDKEQLSFDAANEQLTQVLSHLRQQKDNHASRLAVIEKQIDDEGLSEAAEVLEQLIHMLHTGDCTCPTLHDQHESTEQASGPCSRVVKQVMQLQEDSWLQFKRCSMANIQLVPVGAQLQLSNASTRPANK